MEVSPLDAEMHLVQPHHTNGQLSLSLAQVICNVSKIDSRARRTACSANRATEEPETQPDRHLGRTERRQIIAGERDRGL